MNHTTQGSLATRLTPLHVPLKQINSWETAELRTDMNHISESVHIRQLHQSNLCPVYGERDQLNYPTMSVLTSNRHNSTIQQQYLSINGRGRDTSHSEQTDSRKQNERTTISFNSDLATVENPPFAGLSVMLNSKTHHQQQQQQQLQQHLYQERNTCHVKESQNVQIDSLFNNSLRQPHLKINLEKTPEQNVLLESSSCESSNSNEESFHQWNEDFNLDDIDISTFVDEIFQGVEDNYSSDAGVWPLNLSNDEPLVNFYSGHDVINSNVTSSPSHGLESCDEQKVSNLSPPSFKRARLISEDSCCSGTETNSNSNSCNSLSDRKFKYSNSNIDCQIIDAQKELQRQRKNNAASKRSREKRKQTIEMEEASVHHIMEENTQLRIQLDRMDYLLDKCRNIIHHRFQTLTAAHENSLETLLLSSANVFR